MPRRNLLLLAALTAALASTSGAQSVLHVFDGPVFNGGFGHGVGNAGDVNADGFDDVIVGGDLGHLARVFSGLDGSLLYDLSSPTSPAFFGWSVSGAGDVNADGFADFIIGAYAADIGGDNSGSAWVYSGFDGSILHAFHGNSANDYFGYSVSGAGDVDDDGYADLIVGAYADDPNGTDSGSAEVFSGLDGSVLYTFVGDSAQDWFGRTVSGAGDVDDDGHDDVLVGAQRDDNNGTSSGSVRVFSGLDGGVLYTLEGDSQGDFLGASLSDVGDVNADGHADILVGAPGDGPLGRVFVFSGLDGSTLHVLEGEDSVGWSIGGAGDVNGDGHVDLVVGSASADYNGANSGRAQVFSGLDANVLLTFDGEAASSYLGTSVCGVGDVNGDGRADLVVGALGYNAFHGRVYVFSGCDALGTTYCEPAVPNSTGLPATLAACGNELASGGYLCLHAEQLPPNQPGYFLNSLAQGSVASPGGSQGVLCLAGEIGRYSPASGFVVGDAGADGRISITLDPADTPTPIGPVAVLAGETWNFQCWYRDANPGPTSNFSDALSVTFF